MVGLHWITGCVESDLPSVEAVLPGLRPARAAGRYGHPCCMEDDRGVRVYCGSENPSQPLVLVADGATCEQHGPEVLEQLADLDGWVTRTDLQRDIGPDEDAPERLRSMYAAVRGRELQGPFRSSSWYETEGGDAPGRTLYLGSRQSRQMLRAYDRRGPLRLEFEFHHDRTTGRFPLYLLAQPEGRERAWGGSLAHYTWPGVSWWNELQTDPFAWPAEDEGRLGPLAQAVEDFRQQHGSNLWAMLAMGVTLADLVKVPAEPSTHQRRRWSRWIQSEGGACDNEVGKLLDRRRPRAAS